MTDPAQQKNHIRNDIRNLRKSLNHEWTTRRSAMIQHQATELDLFKQAKCIGLYLSLPFEVDTAQLIETASKQGKHLAVPAAINGEYTWVTYYNDIEIESGPFLVKQPTQVQPFPPEEIDLFFIPGLAFDSKGHRLGHGKGFYDRLLKGCHGHCCGLAFSLQIKEHIPHLDHDIPMQSVLTEDGILWAF